MSKTIILSQDQMESMKNILMFVSEQLTEIDEPQLKSLIEIFKGN